MAQVWSFVAASASVATGANPAPAIPTGRAAGDLLVLVASSAAVFSATPPTGFTQLVRNTTASPFFAVWYKVATGSETAPSVTNSNTTSKATLLCYRKASVLDVAGTLVVGSTTAVATSAVTDAATDDLVLNLYGAGVASTSTRTWSGGSANVRVNSGTTTTLGGLYCTDENQAATGATASRTGTLSGASTGSQGVTISFKQDVNATVAATDAPDGAAVATTVTTATAIAASDGPDVAAIVAANWTTGLIGASDGADAGVIATAVTTGGSTDATDAPDAAAIAASILSTTSGAIDAVDGADQSAFATQATTGAAIAGTDGADSAVIAAASWMTAQIAAFDGSDSAGAATNIPGAPTEPTQAPVGSGSSRRRRRAAEEARQLAKQLADEDQMFESYLHRLAASGLLTGRPNGTV